MFGMHDNGRGHRHFGTTGGSRRWGPFEVRWEIDGDAASGPRGRGRRRMFDGGELRLVLLKLISESPRHGYDLIREIETRTSGGYAPSPGVVYPTLTLLDEMGLIAEEQADGAKKVYAITPDGTAHLAERAEEVDALMARLASLGAHRDRHEARPVRRAMHNLKTVLHHRMGADGDDAERLHQIAAILDEAAQRIERL